MLHSLPSSFSLLCLEALSLNTNLLQVEDNVFLHCLEYGDSKSGKAPVILLLHGFPDLSLSWKYHSERLADAGYFVVTPDLRGYGSSSIPEGGVSAYGKAQLMSDVNELRRYYCGENGSFAMIAGHDWGGVILWAALETFKTVNNITTETDDASPSDPPPLLAKCAAILNAPHPVTFMKHIYTPRQALKSWYMLYFQLPFLPEFVLSWRESLYYKMEKEYQSLVTIIQLNNTDDATCSASPESIKKDLALYKSATADYERVQAMVSYYRATAADLWSSSGRRSIISRLLRLVYNIRDDTSKQTTSVMAAASDAAIEIPTLILWGRLDPYLGQELAYPPPGTVQDLEGPIFLDAGHWVHWEKPYETTERMLSFANSHNWQES
jgi:pimeloyl-ACP methyl ester carboxylesterase